MRNTFNRNKAKLTIAAMAAGMGLHLASHAQAANDSGTLIINGQISASTCVLGMGDGASTANFLLSTIQSTPVNTTIPKSNLPLNITISNCKGGAVGANKVFLVQFTTPRATDSTLMDNETTSAAGGNTGISARITADSRLDVSTQTPLPNVVKSGESFITSAGTTDSKTMKYTVDFVRNSDTATTGAFRSSAVFTMSYQ